MILLTVGATWALNLLLGIGTLSTWSGYSYSSLFISLAGKLSNLASLPCFKMDSIVIVNDVNYIVCGAVSGQEQD